jgi:tetratricopeptide (TPR) repeat protein
MSRIARLVLEGRAGMLSGDVDDAVRAFSEAADLQDDKLRDLMDPPPWWYPVRRSLAAALLKQGRFPDAAAEARRSLAGWPNDALALRVLGEAERRSGRQADARRHRAQAQRAWQGDPNRLPLEMI